MAKRKTRKSNSKEQSKFERILDRIIVFILIIAASYVLDKQYNFISNILYPSPGLAENELAIHIVDVGQGDCIIIELPDGKKAIIDGGPRDAKDDVLNFINAYKITTFDYLMLTHTDEDHVGSLDDVILNTEVKQVYMPNVSTDVITTKVYADFVNAVNGEGLSTENIIYTEQGQTISSESGYEFVIFSPTTDWYSKMSSAKDKNTVSPIVILYYGGRSVMFTGDATEKTENLFLETVNGTGVLSRRNADVDILKVAHHGSKDSTIQEFLDVVKPEISLISVGSNNTYGHPNIETINKLTVYSDKIYRTDQSGDITVKLKPNGENKAEIEVSTEKTEESDNNARVDIDDILYLLFTRKTDYSIFLN